jgi:hypothetical protein
MTTTTMKSFAQSTGQSDNKKSGSFSGSLLGKMAEGLEALEAIANLAEAKVNRFMELAAQAAHVAKQTLDAAMTKPFATPDLEFNASLTPQVPGLGSSTRSRVKTEPDKDE